MNAPLSHESIAPLVVSITDEPSGVVVLFRCPTTGAEVRADGAWPEDGVLERTAGQVKRGLLSHVRTSLAMSLRKAVGSSSSVASIGVDAGNQLIYNAGIEQRSAKHSDKDRREATVRAFARVADRFTWDERQGRYVASDAPAVQQSEFDQLVSAQPLRSAFDSDVAASLVAALIAGDGTVSDAERASYAALFSGRSLDAELGRRAPGRVDLEETSAGTTRETILLLAWAVALTDEALSTSEQAILDDAAVGLQIAPERVAELATIARRHVVDEAIVHLAASGLDKDDVRQQIEQLGEQIGLGADEAARTLIRWTRRQG